MNGSTVFTPPNTCFVGPTRVHNPQPKWHLDLFSCFCTAHGRQSLYFTTGHPFSLSKLPLPMGNPNPPSNRRFLQPIWILKSNGISISLAVFAQLMAERPYTLQWAALPPQNCPFRGRYASHLTRFLGPIWVNNPNSISIELADCLRLTTVTDRQTDHTTWSVTVGRIYLSSTAMWPKMTSELYYWIRWTISHNSRHAHGRDNSSGIQRSITHKQLYEVVLQLTRQWAGTGDAHWLHWVRVVVPPPPACVRADKSIRRRMQVSQDSVTPAMHVAGTCQRRRTTLYAAQRLQSSVINLRVAVAALKEARLRRLHKQWLSASLVIVRRYFLQRHWAHPHNIAVLNNCVM